MKKVTFALSAAFLLAVVLSSCKKYEEGPALSFRTKDARVVNDWDVKYALEDGKDKTFLYKDFTINFTEDGRFVATNIASDSSTVEQSGFWDLVDNKEDIRLIYTDPPIPDDRITYDILKLKDDEFWIREITDSSTWEWRFIPNGTAE